MNELNCTESFVRSVKNTSEENFDEINGMFFLKNIGNRHWGMYLVVHPRNIMRKEEIKTDVQNKGIEQGLPSEGDTFILYFDSMMSSPNDEFVEKIYKTLNHLYCGDEKSHTSDGEGSKGIEGEGDKREAVGGEEKGYRKEDKAEKENDEKMDTEVSEEGEKLEGMEIDVKSKEDVC